jgi:hypothetical protein
MLGKGRGYFLITYVGVGFLLVGMLLFLVSATNPNGLGVFLALGVIVFGMGLVLSYLGHKSNGDKIVAYEGGGSPLPLRWFHYELECRNYERDASSGNRSLGFVLISLGAFVLSISGLAGFFLGPWPLLLLGSALLVPGIFLRIR